jgi:uncharacterized repeat protein (TIGR02543 family)
MNSRLKVMIAALLIMTMIFSIPGWHTAGGAVAHAAAFSGAGTGTVNDPYQVATADQLNEIRNNLTAHYIQTADINLSAYQGASSWVPIGNYVDHFYGSFDGRQHKITDLVISQTDHNPVGLFGFIYTGSRLSNVILENVSVTGVVAVGSLVGDSMGTIKNSSSTGQVQGSDQVGGLVGQLRGPLINSYSRASVSGDYAGGLIGVVVDATLSNSYATGTVTGSVYEAGGLVGFEINGEFVSSYYDEATTAMNDTGRGLGKSTADMENIDTYAGWDFDRIWSISGIENDGYPYLNVRPANISYVGNGNDGGGVPIDPKSYLSGDDATVYSNINGLYKTGYSFDGWNTEQNGNGITYLAGDVFSINEATTLYAMWKYEGNSSSNHSIVSSSNNNLSRLVLKSEGTTLELSPVFAAENVQYTAETDAEQVEIQLAAADSKAVVKLLNQLVGNTISIPLEQGTQTIVFTVKAEDGTEKEYTITLTRRTMTEETPQEAVCPFTDIQNHWAKADICKAVSLGIVEDVRSTIFAPERTLTRLEFVTMLLRTLQIPVGAEETSLPFHDTASLPLGMQSAIHTGVSKGILTGYTDGTFRPHQTISRIELATMLAKAMKWESSSAPKLPFVDQQSIPAWAQPYVGVVHARGILQGRGGNQFAPYGVTTNAEATVIFLRLRKMID